MLFRESDDMQGSSDSLRALANVCLNQGQYARACELVEESLALARETGAPSGTAASLHLYARALLEQGDVRRAQELFEESLELSRSVGYQEGIDRALALLGLVRLLQGDHDRARSLLEESLALSKREGWPEPLSWGLFGLGWLAVFQQDFGLARDCFEQGISLCRQVGNRLFLAFYLEGLAAVVSAQGHPVWAAQLWGAAATLRRELNVAVPLVMRPVYEQLVAHMHDQLGEAAFSGLQTQGQGMTLEEVLSPQEVKKGDEQLQGQTTHSRETKSSSHIMTIRMVGLT
jgi:tetratricopeptide (TPR) repeat protein